MSFVYAAYSSFQLDSANSIQTYATCRELNALDPSVRIVLPRSPLRSGDSRGLPVRFVRKIPFRWILGGRGEEIERLLYARRVAGIAARSSRPVYSRDVRVAHACATLGLPVVFELHRLHEIDWKRLAAFRAIVLLSPALADQLTDQRRTLRLAVIPDGYDDSVFYPRDRLTAREALEIPADAFVVGFSGLSVRGRGLDLLADAYARLTGNRQRRLLIIGPQRKDLESLGIRLSPDVIAVGRRPPREVAELLAAADVVVMPEIGAGIECSPLKMFEYAAMGIPIVAANHPAVRSILNDDARYFEPGSRESLHAALGEEEQTPEPGTRRAAVLRHRVVEYTYAERARRIHELMKSVGV